MKGYVQLLFALGMATGLMVVFCYLDYQRQHEELKKENAKYLDTAMRIQQQVLRANEANRKLRGRLAKCLSDSGYVSPYNLDGSERGGIYREIQ